MDIFNKLKVKVRVEQHTDFTMPLLSRGTPTGWKAALDKLELEGVDVSLSSSLAPEAHFTVMPPMFREDLTKGDLLIGTTWGMALTARLICVDVACTRAVLRFVPTDIADLSSAPPTIDGLARAAKRVPPLLNLQGYPEPPEIQFYDLMEKLKPSFGEIQVHAPPQVMAQWVCMRLDETKPISFTEVMNRVCMAVTAEWVWTGDDITVMPKLRKRSNLYPQEFEPLEAE